MLPRTGPRVILRRFTAADLPRFLAYRSDPEVGLYQGWTPPTEAEAREFLEAAGASEIPNPGGWVQIAVADRATGRLLGDLGLHVSAEGDLAEIGFTLHPDAQGLGLGAEAVSELLALLFERTGVQRVVGVTDARNHASMRLLERVGLRRVGSRNAVFRGEACIEHTFALDRP
jgi:RimJ/RimL family protein N-acetyltransferase